MRIPLFGLLVLLVNVRASANRELPYYIKAYLYNNDKQNYEIVVKEIGYVLEEVIKGKESLKKASSKLSRYFKNCENLISNWLLRWNHLLANNVTYDPFLSQLTIDKLMNKHFALTLQHIREINIGKIFLEQWVLRFCWMQEFVDALHVAVILRVEGVTLTMEMHMFKIIIRCLKDWLTEFEDRLQVNNSGLTKPKQTERLSFGYYGLWTLQDLDRMSSSMEQVPFDLLLKNEKYLRALNILDVEFYSFEDMDSHVQSSKMLQKSLMHQNHCHLNFLVQQMEQRSSQMKNKWQRGKRTQLGKDYEMVEIMWSSWYGLTLPTVRSLESMQGFAADCLIDFFNFGLKGTILASTTTDRREGLALWKVYLSSLDVIFQAIQPDVVPVLKRVHGQCRKIIELWSYPRFVQI